MAPLTETVTVTMTVTLVVAILSVPPATGYYNVTIGEWRSRHRAGRLRRTLGDRGGQMGDYARGQGFVEDIFEAWRQNLQRCEQMTKMLF